MRFGLNTFLFTSPFTNQSARLFPKFKQWGFDSVEIAIENPRDIDPALIKRALDKHGLVCGSVCACFGPDRDLRGTVKQQDATTKYMMALFEHMAVLQSSTVIGPVYSSVGRASAVPSPEHRRQWRTVTANLKTICREAHRRGIQICLEPLNRYETDFINTCEQALNLMDAVGSPALKILLDTFHMNIEEKSPAEAIRKAGKHLGHLHASASDRGTPGRDHTDWPALAQALKDIGYQGDVVIESFTPDVKMIARAAAIWRRIEPTREEIAVNGVPVLAVIIELMKKLLSILTFAAIALTASAADKKIVFLAGPPSHGPGEHKHRAGCLLFQSCLDKLPGISTVVYSNGWPTMPEAFAGAATIVVYSDGAAGHPLLQADHLKTIGALMDQGVGLVCLHFAVEPTIEKGEKEFLNWLGGAFEINYSVNPAWTAHFFSLPEHPITRGVKPFEIHDEWYFNMRFRDGMSGITPILTAIPDTSTTNRADGAHEGNPIVRKLVAKGVPQHMAWAVTRADGGRAFALTGGHAHKNWGDDNLRKLVLNAILWTAKIEVPADGVASTVTPEQLKENLDPKGRGR